MKTKGGIFINVNVYFVWRSPMVMKKELIPIIESNLNKMTATERDIANYFLNNRNTFQFD